MTTCHGWSSISSTSSSGRTMVSVPVPGGAVGPARGLANGGEANGFIVGMGFDQGGQRCQSRTRVPEKMQKIARGARRLTGGPLTIEQALQQRQHRHTE